VSVGDGRTRGGDGVTNAPGVGASLGGVGFVLPSGLASRFEVVERLVGEGGQALLWLVRDRDDGGELRVLKVYLARGGGSDAAALELVRGASRVGEAGHAHLVELFEHGEVGGHLFEVMEYCPADSLARLFADEGPVLDAGLVSEVVREVAGALVFLHGLQADGRPVVHRDVKPANVLVRSREGLDLVLCDYGLSRALSQSVEFRSGHRTPLYAPPEAAHGVVSPGWDWWSLGVIVVEMRIGRHPFVSAGGSVDYDVLTGVADVDLSGVGDDRLRLLCAGLLTRDSGDRWGGMEVGEWLAGGSPAVYEPVVKEPEVEVGGVGVQPFEFGGVGFADPVLLAGALAGDWDSARAIVANTGEARKDHTRLRGFLDSLGLVGAVRCLDATTVDPDLRLVRFLCALDPSCPPVFRGFDVSRLGLAGLAGQAAGGDEAALAAVGVLADEPVLSEFARVEPVLREIEDRWEGERQRLRLLVSERVGGDDPRGELVAVQSRLVAELLQAACDPRVESALRERSAGACSDRTALSRAWFLAMAGAAGGNDHLADRLIATRLHATARRQGLAQPALDLEAEMGAALERLVPIARTTNSRQAPEWGAIGGLLGGLLLIAAPFGVIFIVMSAACGGSSCESSSAPWYLLVLGPICFFALLGGLALTAGGLFATLGALGRAFPYARESQRVRSANRAAVERDREIEAVRAGYMRRIEEARRRAEELAHSDQ